MRFTFATFVALLPLALSGASARSSGINRRHPAPPYSGDLTHYDVGLGSCGITSAPTDAIVALAVPMMKNGANPNNNPLCGQKITIVYDNKSTQATVVDTCEGCAMDDLDASPSLFETVAPNGNGRVHGVTWYFDSTADGKRP